MDVLETNGSALQPIYLVRVSTKNGTFSIVYPDTAQAARAVASFHEAGFSSVAVFDGEGRRIDASALDGRAA